MKGCCWIYYLVMKSIKCERVKVQHVINNNKRLTFRAVKADENGASNVPLGPGEAALIPEGEVSEVTHV